MQVLECQSLSAMQALDSRSADQYTSWPHRFNSFSHSSPGKLRKISNSWFWRLRFLWALIRKSFDGFILFPLEVLFPIFSLTFYSHLRTKWPMTIFGIRFFMKKSAVNVLLPTYLCLQNWAINYRFLSGPGNYWATVCCLHWGKRDDEFILWNSLFLGGTLICACLATATDHIPTHSYVCACIPCRKEHISIVHRYICTLRRKGAR